MATCMYYTGIEPFSKQQVYVAHNLRDGKMQRALMQFFKLENWLTVREALETRRRKANEEARGEYVHQIPNTGIEKRKGYRPGRKTAHRQQKRKGGRQSPSA